MYNQVEITNKIYELFDEYNSFAHSNGQRIKAVEWAAFQINKVKEILVEFGTNEKLLHKIGWNTFVGFGLYSSIIDILNTNTKREFIYLCETLKTLLNDIIIYTNIGHFISLDVEFNNSEKMQFSKMDTKGNIFIYPSDTDELLDYIKTINNDY